MAQENDPKTEDEKPEVALEDLSPEKDAVGGGGQGRGKSLSQDPPIQAE